MAIIQIINDSEILNNCIYLNRPVMFKKDDGTVYRMPCIGVYTRDLGINIVHTGLEIYIIDFARHNGLSSTSLNKKAKNVCSFLNYLLWNEPQVDNLQDVDIQILKRFLINYKTKSDGTTRKADTWSRCRCDVWDFLSNYYNFNKDKLDFKYSDRELFKLKDERLINFGKWKTSNSEYAGLFVKPPTDTNHKNRYLPLGYLDLMIHTAKKYKPQLVLPISLMAYAGLREGELVNVTRSSIKFLYGSYQTLAGAEIDLTKQADYAQHYDGKTEFGSIKRFRRQNVYYDFVKSVKEYYDNHILLLDTHFKNAGKQDIGLDGPLFLNDYGRPLTVSAFTSQLKKFFYDYFLPELKLYCQKQNTYPENAPYIEAFENEYPGAHMFRHWFTMYLLTQAKLSTGEIVRWRGDACEESMLSYIHINREMIDAYKNCAFVFTEMLLEDMYEYSNGIE